jgi:hypothetical protein
LAYQPPADSTFLSEQTSHQQPASSTFLSKQISLSHLPPAKRTGRKPASPCKMVASSKVSFLEEIKHGGMTVTTFFQRV